MKKFVSIATALAAGFAGYFIVDYFFDQQRANYPQEKIAAELGREMPKTIALLESDFPEDYQDILENLKAIIRDGGAGGEIRTKSSEVIAAIRRKYADNVAKAPDTAVRAFLTRNIEFQQQVRDEDGPNTCAEVAITGPNTLPLYKLSKYYPALDNVGEATFTAIRQGMDSPVSREPASDADWSFITSALNGKGVSEKEINVLASVNGDDPRYCRLIILFLQEMHDLEGAPGERVRASFAKDIAAG